MVDALTGRAFRSPFPDVDVPTSSISNYAFRHAARLTDKPAIIDASTGAVLSYGEVARTAQALAQGLVKAGLQVGEVVAILAPNMTEYPIIFHGVAKAGGTLTTLNPLYTEAEIRQQLDLSGATWLVTVSALADKAENARVGTSIKRVIVVGDDVTHESHGTLASLLEFALTSEVQFDPATHVMVLPFSSGTTGLPKGVMLSHRNLLALLAALEIPVPLNENDVTLAVLPFFHIYGMNVIMNPSLAAGATIVTMPRFELDKFLQAIQDFRVTVVYAAPPMVLALAQCSYLDRYDLSSLRWLMSGAAPLDGRTAAEAEKRLGCTVFQAYGMTEASPGVFTTSPDDPGSQDSVGRLLPNFECRVVDLATGADLGVGQDGEILIRGPQIMLGYLKDEVANANAIDAEGYYRSGDVGHVDENGNWFIVDRVKELIKYKGYQVAPAELEAILLALPGIVDSAVIGAPAGDDGETPVAFVVVESHLDAREIMEFVAKQVAPYKRIRGIEFVPAIPRSASGKILRRVLKSEYLEKIADVALSRGALEARS